MDDKVLELITKMHSEMKNGFDGVNIRFDKLENGQTILEDKLDNTRKPCLTASKLMPKTLGY